MSEPICPFSATLVQEDFACANARPIVRRGGAEIACRSGPAQARCQRLFQGLKEAALPAFGVKDDLLSMPHSVLVKVQYGGLLGLQRRLAAGPGEVTTVADIDALVTAAVERFGSIGAVPCTDMCEDIVGYRLPGRRGRRKS